MRLKVLTLLLLVAPIGGCNDALGIGNPDKVTLHYGKKAVECKSGFISNNVVYARECSDGENHMIASMW